MLSSLRRWRDQPLGSVTSCVRRPRCSRRHPFWIVLILLVVCIAVQTFVARQTRTYKPTWSPDLSDTFNQQDLFPSVQSYLESLRSEDSLEAELDVKSPQGERPPHLDHQNEGYGKQEDNNVDQISSITTNSQVDAREVSAEKPRPAQIGYKTSLGFTTRKGKGSTNTPTSTSFSKTQFNGGHAEPTCQPKSHIVFLKTHKTASSTILNVLYRYGETKNLTFALPVNKHSQLFYPFFFASHFVEGVRSGTVKEFHIMCNHMRFKKSEVAKVMPLDTFYFSILRDPVTMMESIFIYYKSIPAFSKIRTLDDFLNSCWKTYNSSLPNNHYAHNILGFDFGLDNNVTADTADLEVRSAAAIGAIEQDFHLILISEYFDESMILLKHILCWSLEDVASFKLNSRTDESRHPPSPETAEKIKRWNALDWGIYLHFNTTFWHKVDTLIGREQMKREVSELKELQAKLANTCLKDGGAVAPSQIKDAGLKPLQYGAAVIQGYNLNPLLDTETKKKCQRFIIPELQYTDRLYTQQFQELVAKRKRETRIVASQRHRPNRTTMTGKFGPRKPIAGRW